MDPISLGFYAAVCGTLGAAAPWLGSIWVRIGIGAAVGLVAATVLPLLREAMGAMVYAPGAGL